MRYFGIHNHTHYSNIRLLDSINRPKDLINKAIEYGMTGIAITDHECLSSHVEVVQHAKSIREKHPDFRVALGNEIYLTETRDKSQKYFHFILIAKDAIGHRALRELSSTAWYNSYHDRGMERVPTLKSELKEVLNKYKGHVIGSTACLGGEFSQLVLKLIELETNNGSLIEINNIKGQIVNFLEEMKSIFGDDFYIEVAPGTGAEQVAVNRRAKGIAKAMGYKLVFGTDSHYLTKADRFVHKAYLNSKEGEREVDDFYEFSFLMNQDEIVEYLSPAFTMEEIEEMVANTNEIQSKIEFYDLAKEQTIPVVKVKHYPVCLQPLGYEFIDKMRASDSEQDRYWANYCLDAMEEKGLVSIEYMERLNTEAEVIDFISQRLGQSLTAYFNTLQSYINLFWDCGSILGPGRGSAVGFLSNYLLGITQLDPVKWNLPWWRFLNKERAEMPDIDIDIAPSKRPAIFKAIREKIGEINILQVATFGTEGTKSAILTACRGYRTEEFPEGIDVDTAQYMTSLIPSERGFLWSLNDVINGNAEKNRKPIRAFIEEVNQYDGLLEIMMSIEGIINKRSSHAAGVVFYNGSPYETAAIMRTPSGDLITQYSLHDAEYAGDIKYDFLVTEISDKIISCLEFLQKDNVIEQDLSLRELYDKYLHPSVLDLEREEIWKALGEGTVLDVFQFNTAVGLQAAKVVKPQNVGEMTAANALMRLMGEQGKETPMEKYVRMKKDPNLWKQEAKSYGLTDEDIKIMSKYYERHYGVPPYQEDLMTVLMDKDTCNFTLAESNAARKLVAKKQMDKIGEFRIKIFDRAKNENMARYLWDTLIAPQLGYGFSELHSLAYSFVGVQTLELATRFPAVYWNTACLAVNSGSADEDNEGKSTDYGKVAKAMGEIMGRGIQVSLLDINKSDFGFKPDVDNNEILFGLKGVNGVGDELVHNIIANRPYVSMMDFVEKVGANKQAMISLIKGGAFDKLENIPRQKVMVKYLWETCDKKKRLTLQNFNGLIEAGLIPQEIDFERRVFNFNKQLKAINKGKEFYFLPEPFYKFYVEFFDEEDVFVENGMPAIEIKGWDKIYQNVMDGAREWLKNNHDTVLDTYNKMIFKAEWDKYAKGTVSAWEMDSLCFYYGEHELAHVNLNKYGIKNFGSLPEEPVVDYYFKKNGKDIPIFKLDKIVGTCIDKNKTKSTVTILTTDGVVDVKFRAEYFALKDKQLSEKQPDGSKKVVEKSWFSRGSMIMLTGFRRGDSFVPKKYSKTPTHQVYKIDEITSEGDIKIRHTRYGEE